MKVIDSDTSSTGDGTDELWGIEASNLLMEW